MDINPDPLDLILMILLMSLETEFSYPRLFQPSINTYRKKSYPQINSLLPSTSPR
ncbi:hypothetical protein HanXRQr2_Chr04g0164261 [Helianthus annuus]|uniref:Uncharacterized protein n=1 Tax=Helianthus annuus TaxID=4232 RepID=A0A9K3NSQ3_HELAN|nr:hypothetical protein HanXRQr2_Chr04g0164261 [Helianthus annuus]KAJ0931152.1 hypothetical protein HanPSC8_Chr04g0158191 [Helianthus annuus]